MKKTKRLLVIILSVLLSLNLFSFSAYADQVDDYTDITTTTASEYEGFSAVIKDNYDNDSGSLFSDDMAILIIGIIVLISAITLVIALGILLAKKYRISTSAEPAINLNNTGNNHLQYEKICPFCNAKNIQNGIFCSKCGRKF